MSQKCRNFALAFGKFRASHGIFFTAVAVGSVKKSESIFDRLEQATSSILYKKYKSMSI